MYKRIIDRETTPGKIELYKGAYTIERYGTTGEKVELYKGARWYWNCALHGDEFTYCYFGDAKTFEEALDEMLYHMKRVHDVRNEA